MIFPNLLYNDRELLQIVQWLTIRFGRSQSILVQNCDQKRLLQLMAQHRIFPLVIGSMKKSSNAFSLEIQQLSDKIQLQHTNRITAITGETIGISKQFQEAKIKVISLKGPCLSYRLYNDPFLRQTRDIDLLIMPKDVEDASDLLIQLGYILKQKRSERFKKLHQNYNFFHPTKKTALELHWRLLANDELFAIEDSFFDNAEEVVMANQSIYHLDRETEFIYLCLHGSLHQWSELAWLSDIAAYIKNISPNMDQIMERAKKYNIERPVLLAIQLVNQFNLCATTRVIPMNHVLESLLNTSIKTIINSGNGIKANKICKTFYLMKFKTSLSYQISCINLRYKRALHYNEL